VYLEQHKGRAAYDREIAATKARMDKLRAQGQGSPFALGGLDRCPWALVQIPYVKGALFLSQLRTEFGEENFGEESRFTPPGMRAA
jgi:hypothetical protein